MAKRERAPSTPDLTRPDLRAGRGLGARGVRGLRCHPDVRSSSPRGDCSAVRLADAGLRCTQVTPHRVGLAPIPLFRPRGVSGRTGALLLHGHIQG